MLTYCPHVASFTSVTLFVCRSLSSMGFSGVLSPKVGVVKTLSTLYVQEDRVFVELHNSEVVFQSHLCELSVLNYC